MFSVNVVCTYHFVYAFSQSIICVCLFTQTESQQDRQTNRPTHSQLDREIDRQTDRQAGRQTEK